MKTQIMKGASIMIAALFFGMLMTPVFAAPPIPFERYGTANVAATTVIGSWIDGVQYGAATVQTGGAYSISTAGQDTDITTYKNGGVNPDVIRYSTTSLTGSVAKFATETNTFVIGGISNGALTYGADVPLLKISVLSSQSGLAVTDYILIYNPHTAAVDATGYSIGVGTAAAQAIVVGDIPSTATTYKTNPIPAGSYLVINMAKWGGLSNTGNAVRLLFGANTVDRVEYGTGMTIPQETMMTNAANPAPGQEIYRQPNPYTDTNGCTADFSSRAVSMIFDTVAPTITATTIADNAVNQPITAGVYEATWSEAMAAVGSVTTNLPGAVFTWPSTTVYRITYTALAYNTVYTITYNGFTDVVGNAATGDLAKQFTTMAAPASTATITVVAPASPSNDNTPAFTYTVTNAPTSVEFYRAPAPAGPWTLFGTDATPGDLTWTSGVIADGTYYFAARGIGATSEAVPTASEYGPYTIDTVAPTITATTIADNAIDQPIAAGVYEATWSEAMAAVGSVTTNLPGAVFTWPSTTVYRITYTALAYSTVYTITYNGFTDVAGNAAAGDLAKQFTTLAPSVSTATITNIAPASPTTDNTPTFTYTVTNAPTSVEFYRAPAPAGPWTLFGTDATPGDLTWTSAAIADGTYYFAARGIGAASEAVPTASEYGPYTIDTTNPVANAGADMTISAPTQKLDATATDATSGVATTVWTFPANVICSNVNILNPTFSASATGVYTVTLTVTDNVGLTHQDTFSLDYTIASAGVTPWDISCHKSGSDILIDWTTGTGPFDIYIADTVTGAGPYVLLQAGVAGMSYTHVGALTDGLSHSYYVTADGGVTKSNLGFKLVKALVDNGLANNWIALPPKCDITTADLLMNAINADGPGGNAVYICTQWLTATQVFQSRTQATLTVRVGVNFALVPGVGYQVKMYAGKATTFNIVGAAPNKDASYVTQPLNLNIVDNGLANNWIALPYNTVLTTADALMNAVNAAGSGGNSVYICTQWLTATQVFQSRTQATLTVRVGVNFALSSGTNYQLKMYSGKALTWNMCGATLVLEP